MLALRLLCTSRLEALAAAAAADFLFANRPLGRSLACPWSQTRSLMNFFERHAVEREKRKQADTIVVYRGKWMRPFRLVVRLKVIQLAGVAALVVPLAHISQHGSMPLTGMLASGAVVAGAGAASAALWYYSRRYVGELALTRDRRHVQISVMDFWGNRKDVRYDVREIIPPLLGLGKQELECAANKLLTPLNVIGDRQFVLSLRHGDLKHKELLFELLHGRLYPHEMESFPTQSHT